MTRKKSRRSKNRPESRSRTERKSSQKSSPNPRQSQAKKTAPVATGKTVEGTLQVRREGYGFVLSEVPGEGDVFIPPRYMGDAWNGDRVLAEVRKNPRDDRFEGSILKVLARSKQHLVGELKKIRNQYFASVAMNGRVVEFLIAPNQLGGAKPEQSVGVLVTKYPEGAEQGEGEIVKIFPERGEEKTELEVIILSHQLPTEFPAKALEEARAYQDERGAGASDPGRVDLRALPFVTIDGETAKDFDDAILVKREGGGFRLWVSIADVSYYVRPGSALDKEAWRRGTSVYFPGHVIPMLPEELSNDLCSLRPLEDRLTFTCEILFDAQGRPQESKVYRSVIHSRGRLTYNQVAKGIIGGDEEIRKQLGPELTAMLTDAMEYSRVLRRIRFERGSIDFDMPEPDIVFNLEEGDIARIVKAERNEAHFLIEEYMIAANEAVARFVTERGWPSLYRIHDQPDPEKLHNFHELLHNLGFNIAFPKKPSPKFFNQVLQEVKGHAEEQLVQHMLLRSMKQAVYSQENLGHFGLASPCYTHFTSPIRRYPDLVVHRILAEVLGNKRRIPSEEKEKRSDDLARIGKHTSARERAAMEAQYEAVDLEVALFMKKYVGQTFKGAIARIAKFGFFVELRDFFVQGLVLLEDLKEDYYVFDEKKHRLRGRRSGRVFKIGTELEVVVEKVDILERKVYFSLTP